MYPRFLQWLSGKKILKLPSIRLTLKLESLHEYINCTVKCVRHAINYKSKFECDKGTCIALRRVVPIPVLGNTSQGLNLGFAIWWDFWVMENRGGFLCWQKREERLPGDPRPSWGFYQLGIWSLIYQWNSGFNINLYPYSTTNIEAQFLSQYLEALESVLLNSIPSSFFLSSFPPSLFPSFFFLSFIFRKVMSSVRSGTRSIDIYALTNKPIHTRGIKTEKSLMSSQVIFYCKILIKKPSEFQISKLQISDSLYGCWERSLTTWKHTWPHLR